MCLAVSFSLFVFSARRADELCVKINGNMKHLFAMMNDRTLFWIAAVLKGYQRYHNYIRPREALHGKTLSEACGKTIEAENNGKP